MGSLVVQPRSRLFHGHEWVYATDVKIRSGDPEPGDVVTLKDVRGRPLGSAIFNPKSQIIARRFSFRRQDLDAEFFVRRIERAWKLRQRLGIDTTLCRVVWSESDGVPGLIVDRYGDHVVIQTLTLAMSLREDLIVEAIKQVFSPQTITARNEVAVRRAEGMDCEKKMLHGSQPAPFSLQTAGMTFQIDVWDGQKTGLYLDQIDNYSSVARWAKGKRVIDCFCNQGGFAQACAQAGAASVLGVDSSESALASAAVNSSSLNIDWKAANVFDYLKEAESKNETSDLIVLDPPSFTRTKGSVNDALRGYKEIHLRAMKMLPPGGILATFSCSHHISTGDFYTMIGDAAVDARRKLRLIDTYRQRADHPIILGMPETEYLRGYAFEIVGGW
ncbi:MAG: class I SAM-dependent rRNA methyltransferase [Verrucomicrobiaceae bacterium]|nr:class I SAM-dependent rRNA methyltransferase [Verrucomicrobiaceae bacterium]